MDVWALGVLVFLLGSKKQPFSGANRNSIYKNIVERLKNDSDNYFMTDFPDFYSYSLKEFIKDLLIFDSK